MMKTNSRPQGVIDKKRVESGEQVSRRSFLMASAALMVPGVAWSESRWNAMLCWTLADAGDVAKETNTGTDDAIASRTGHATWVGSGRDRALRLDGYSVWVTQQNARLRVDTGAITLSAWVALESYPVNDAAIIDLDFGADGRMTFAVDRLGFLLATRHASGASTSCRSARAVEKTRWHHVAAVVDGTRMALYMDGAQCGRASIESGRNPDQATANVSLGLLPDCPIVSGVFHTGVLNGLLRDVRVFNGALMQNDISRLIAESSPGGQPELEINRAWCADDPQRPRYHAMPPRAWTNEPHGLIHWGGQYHLFYQKNPNGPYWGHINWGHLTSSDLYRWSEAPVAVWPEPGPDSEGCWSGSAIEYEGKLAIIYTGGDGHRASICLALSDDGVHFTKHPENPVIAEPPQGLGYKEFRDPFVWREGSTFYLIIGSAVAEKGGTALLYRSKDLIHWEYRKPLLVGDRATSGVFWEMPIFVDLGGQHALIVCEVPGRASYWVGTWKDETFTPQSQNPQRLELFNHMLSPTPHVLEDGRVIAMGIIPDERSPKECWRNGWAHHYSLPRLITADAGGSLRQSPFEGIDAWCEPVASLANVELTDGLLQKIEDAAGRCINLSMRILRGDSRSITLHIRTGPDAQEHTDLRYEWETGRLIFDRTRSSLDPEVRRDREESFYAPLEKDRLELDIYLDCSVLEVFVDRRSAFAGCVYPTLAASTGTYARSEGSGARIEALTVRRIRKPQ